MKTQNIYHVHWGRDGCTYRTRYHATTEAAALGMLQRDKVHRCWQAAPDWHFIILIKKGGAA
jgi:hypothetical protein